MQDLDLEQWSLDYEALLLHGISQSYGLDISQLSVVERVQGSTIVSVVISRLSPADASFLTKALSANSVRLPRSLQPFSVSVSTRSRGRSFADPTIAVFVAGSILIILVVLLVIYIRRRSASAKLSPELDDSSVRRVKVTSRESTAWINMEDLKQPAAPEHHSEHSYGSVFV